MKTPDPEKMMMQRRIDNLCEQLEIVKNKLEEEKNNHQHTYECALTLEEEWVQMKRERDALKRDLYFECQDSLHACYICNFGTPSVAFCERAKEMDDCFVWRGLCKENGGIEG